MGNAAFTPSFTDYKSLKPFRFWCQKVLPTVYDDSLSYYELLSKVVSYLNDVIDDMEAVEANTDAILGAFNQLQDYVNEYLGSEEFYEQLDDAVDAKFASEEFTTQLTNLVNTSVGNQIGGAVASQIGDTVAGQIGSTVASQIDGVVSNQIGAAVVTPVNNWLDANITQPTDPVIDASLTVEGAAADAKAAGDGIRSATSAALLALSNQYKTEMRMINSSNTDTVCINGSINGTGGHSVGVNNRARMQYTKVKPNTLYKIELTNTAYRYHTGWEYATDEDSSAILNLARTGYYFDNNVCFFITSPTTNYIRFAFAYVADDTHTMTETDRTAIMTALHLYEVSYIPTRIKVKTGDYEFFKVTVPRPISFGDEAVITSTEEIECVLRLPDSYTPNGKPTRLIFMAHVAHGYIEESSQTWYSSGWTTLCNALLAAGYALFDANVLSTGSTSPNEIGYANGSPLYINNIKAAYDYIQTNYNVYSKIFCHGTSMGGVGAGAFTHAYPELVLAESSFAGRSILKDLKQIYNDEEDYRFANSFGYADIATLNADKFSHVEGLTADLSLLKLGNNGMEVAPDRNTNYTEWLSYFTAIYAHNRADNVGTFIGKRTVPKKAWNSWADNEQDTKLETTLQRAYTAGSACPYYIVNYESGTHTQMCFGQINNMINQLIAWYKRWE